MPPVHFRQIFEICAVDADNKRKRNENDRKNSENAHYFIQFGAHG